MTDTEIITNINSVLLEMDFPAVEEHYYHAPLSDFLLMDSLDITELIITVEKRFDILIVNEQAEKIKTFRQLVECVKDLKK